MREPAASNSQFDKAIEANTFAVQGLFPTPLLSATVANHAALNKTLSTATLAREKVERGVTVSNSGGWHSNEFLSWCGDEGECVIEAGRQMANRMTVTETATGTAPANINWQVSAWANISRAGHSNRAHAHPGAFWSGVYWVDDGGIAEDAAAGGLLEVADPRGVATTMYAPQLRFALNDCLYDGRVQPIQPKAGVMVLFPSWLMHSVAPYSGKGVRISIAFNLSVNASGGAFPLAR